MANYYNYWGKADTEGCCHLLVYHSLDVAAVGKIWLERSPGFLERASKATGLSMTAFSEWFLFFLALHDVGKFSITFQNLRTDLLEELQGKKTNAYYTVRHDQMGWILWEETLCEEICLCIPGLDEDSKDLLRDWLNIFAQFVTGHHGIPPERVGPARNLFSASDVESSVEFVNQLLKDLVSGDSMDMLSSLCKSADHFDVIESSFKYFSWQLAGLTSLCDWIASGDETFIYCSEPYNLRNYFIEACQKAEKAINRAEIVPSALSIEMGMERLFPEFADYPTPLQSYCNNVAVNSAPQLWILEDVTGSGKTEAALTLTSRILGAGGGTGCFVALPTMATSNAMYERMAEVYLRLYADGSRPSLVLSHGSRHLSKLFRDSYRDSLETLLHEEEGADEDRDEGKVHCSQWLADSSKKSLLSDVGVGTVDQVLLAGLPVRYQSMRAFGMSQKVLIVDEVHVFDAYVLRLLENIITAQAAFGGSVILLSATLPFSVREKFCNAFVLGLNKSSVCLQKRDTFPLITTVSSHEVCETGVATRHSVAREVAVEFCVEIADVYALIERSILAGKCVCWIRNTIADVTTSFDELNRRDINHLDMFHSRFALNDRLSIEQRVLKRFGKTSTPDERHGRILVASQVVEQSLDLDFDVMISDLAPIDLLIQRAGRLHRHERGERDKPVFFVHTPKDTEEPTAEWYAESFPIAKWVYPDVALLWRTKEILKDRRRLKMPEEARLLIEAVYGGEEALQITDIFMNSEDEASAEQMNKKSFANFNRLKFEQGYCRMSNDMNKWESDEKVSTRLSDETNKLYLCRWVNGCIVPFHNDNEFAWDLSSLSLRKSLLASIDYEDIIQDAVDILMRQKRFKYDTLFLVFSCDECLLSGIDGKGAAVLVRYCSVRGLTLEIKN
jgi:CRISPR-associated endonuclease/helicase Cas3